MAQETNQERRELARAVALILGSAETPLALFNAIADELVTRGNYRAQASSEEIEKCLDRMREKEIGQSWE